MREYQGRLRSSRRRGSTARSGRRATSASRDATLPYQLLNVSPVSCGGIVPAQLIAVRYSESTMRRSSSVARGSALPARSSVPPSLQNRSQCASLAAASRRPPAARTRHARARSSTSTRSATRPPRARAGTRADRRCVIALAVAPRGARPVAVAPRRRSHVTRATRAIEHDACGAARRAPSRAGSPVCVALTKGNATRIGDPRRVQPVALHAHRDLVALRMHPRRTRTRVRRA